MGGTQIRGCYILKSLDVIINTPNNIEIFYLICLGPRNFSPPNLHFSRSFIQNHIGRTQTWFRDYWKFSKCWKIFWSFCWASKMTPTDEFWVRRRILEPRYRNMRSWNLSLGKLPLKIIFSGKFFCHHLDCSKLHAQCNFHGEISRNSRVIVKIPFLEHQRFYSMWLRITWHMGIFRLEIYSRIQKFKNFWNPPTQFLSNAFFSKMRRQKSIFDFKFGISVKFPVEWYVYIYDSFWICLRFRNFL